MNGEDLKAEIERLRNGQAEEVETLRHIVEKQSRMLASHQALLSRLMLFEEMHPRGELRTLQELGVAVLRFIHALCVKHNIDYWIDCGTLLGGVRHDGYIPWDDDIDIAMTRGDYERFMRSLDEEISALGLSAEIIPTRYRYDKEEKRIVSRHLQVKFGHPYNIYMLDVFPYDFVLDSALADLDPKRWNSAEYPFWSDLIKAGIMDSSIIFRGQRALIGGTITADERALFEQHASRWGFTTERQKNIAPGIDGVKYRRVIPIEHVFPTRTGVFEGVTCLMPRDPKSYLHGMYGPSYLDLPEEIEDHGRIRSVRGRVDFSSRAAELERKLDDATTNLMQWQR